MNYVNLGAAALCAILGLLVLLNRAPWMLESYRVEAKEGQYDMRKLCRAAGILLLALSGLCLGMFLLGLVLPKLVVPITLAGWLAYALMALGGLLYIGMAKRFRV